MSAYQILLTELDRCDYIVDYQYTGCLSDYTYNGVTYAETSEAYSRRLERLYLDFLNEWSTLSEADKQAAKAIVELIVAKRYLYGDFFFDVPTLETVNEMANDSGVPVQSVNMARFVCEMVGCQKFYLRRIAQFFGIEEVNDEQHPSDVTGVSMKENVESRMPDREDEEFEEIVTSESEKEWITYEELIQMFDFRGVKSAKDASWRKKNGFDKCVSQSGGKGSAVKYSVSKIKDWLNNGKISKR